MNRKDRDNLTFILATAQAGDAQLTNFLDTLEDDDLEYALELLTRYRAAQENLVDSLIG